MCLVCLNAEKTVAYNCGHLATCESCNKNIRQKMLSYECPICRESVRNPRVNY